MKAHNLLPARRYSERPEHAHDGEVIVMRSNPRWCSDGFEFTLARKGDVVRSAFIIDATAKSLPGAPWRMPASVARTFAT
jgi:hypothetical protein